MSPSEVWIFFFSMLCISLLASKPVASKTCEKENGLRGLKMKSQFALCDLKIAEKRFVRYLFRDASFAYTRVELLDGITFPVGNMSDPQTLESMQTINDHLTNQLLPIIQKLNLQPSNLTDITRNVSRFRAWFHKLVKLTVACQSQTEPELRRPTAPASGNYAMRAYALQVLHLARRWSEEYTGVKPGPCEEEDLGPGGSR